MFRKKVTTFLKKSAWGRAMMEPLRKVYHLYALPHRRAMLRKYGPEILSDLAEIFRRHDIAGFAAYGTLLGFVREHGFIPHDDDIDLGFLPTGKSAPEILAIFLNQEKGFTYMFGFKYQGKLTEFTLGYKHLSIDFFFYEDNGNDFSAMGYKWYPHVNYPDASANSALRVHEPRITGLHNISVFGVDFPIPDNEEAVLAALYGETWRIPDAHWSTHPHVDECEDFGYLVSLEEALKP